MKTTPLQTIRTAAAVCLASAALVSQPAHAITYYWDTNDTAAGSGNATGTWDSSVSALFTQTANGTATTTANTTTSADTLTFSAGNGGASVAQQNGTPGTITVSGNQTAASVTLNQSDLAFTGGNITTPLLVVNANATISSGLVNNTNIRFDTAGQTLTLSGGGSNHQNITGNSDAIALASTLVLSSGTYTTLQNNNTQFNIGSASAETGGVVINSGATLSQPLGTASFQIGNGREGLVTVNAGGNLTIIPAANLLVGRGAGNGGKLLVTGGNLTSGGPVAIGFAMTANSTNTVTVSEGSLTTTGDIGIGTATTSAAAASASFILNISGGTVTTGNTSRGIKFGGAIAGNGAQLGNSTVGTGTLNMTGGALYVGTAGISKSGTGSYAVGGINLSGGIIGAQGNWSSSLDMNLGTTNGPITFQSANQTGTAYNITLSGNLTGSGGLTKTGTGSLTLTGANTYNGTTTVSTGTLVVSGGGSINTSANITVSTGATLTNDTVTAITPALLLGEGSALAGSGSFTPVALTLTANLADGFTPISAGSALTKAGALTFTLTGVIDGTYTLFTGTPASSFASVNVGGSPLTFDSGDSLWKGSAGGFDYAYSDTANTLAVAAVPEPGTWIMVGIGLTFLLYRKRNRRVES